MKTVSICSSFYESGRPYLDACMNSIIDAVAATDCQAHMVVAIDNLQDPEGSLSKYADDLDLVMVPTADGTTISGVRNAGFKKAKSDTSDFLIFLDMDDLIAEQGIRLHLESLAEADISYGDMELIDQQGRSLSRTLYSDITIPQFVESVDVILQRNFLGLSNTAIRRTALDRLPSPVPEHLVATDWWFYTSLINQGCTARKTSGAIGSYRQHSANVLGGNPAANIESLKKRCTIVREHYAALPPIEGIEGLDQRVEKVERAIDADVEGLSSLIEQANKTPGAWFEEVFRIADQMK